MTTSEFIRKLIEQRDSLQEEFNAALNQGDAFRAEDIRPHLQFSIRQANDALMGR